MDVEGERVNKNMLEFIHHHLMLKMEDAIHIIDPSFSSSPTTNDSGDYLEFDVDMGFDCSDFSLYLNLKNSLFLNLLSAALFFLSLGYLNFSFAI